MADVLAAMSGGLLYCITYITGICYSDNGFLLVSEIREIIEEKLTEVPYVKCC